MRFLLSFTVLLSIIWGCTPGNTAPADPISFMPADMQLMLQVHDAEAFRTQLQSNEILAAHRKSQKSGTLETLDSILSLNLGKLAFIAFTKDSAQAEQWILVFKEPVFQPTDSLDITPSSWQLPEGSSWKTADVNPWRLVASSDAVLSQALLAKYRPSESLKTVIKTANSTAGATLFVPTGMTHPLTHLLGPAEGMPKVSSDGLWDSYDLQITGESLLMEGLIAPSDSLFDPTRLFYRVPYLPLIARADIVPAATDAWFTFSIQDQAQFLANQFKLLGKTHNWNALVESVEQLSLMEINGDVTLVLHALNADGIRGILEPFQTALTEFQEVPLYALQQNTMLQEAFAPLLGQLPEPGYYASLDQLFVFTPTLEALQNWISDYKRENTLYTNKSIDPLRSRLFSEGSTLAVVSNPKKSTLLQDSTFIFYLPPALITRIPKEYLFTAQKNTTNPYNFNTYSLERKSNGSEMAGSVSLKLNLKLEGLVAAGPFFVKNHLNNRLDIAVQDNQNQLYLYSDQGELLWKKSLSGIIQGPIQQMDMFKNGKLQMAFTTNDNLYVLDHNGAEVQPFPMKFSGGNLNPLALFDYEKNKNYRFVVTQGKKVFMLDGKGKKVTGFKFSEAESPIARTPQHFRIGNRDYLVFRLENGRLNILNRVGDTRVKVGETFAFSDNDIFLFENTFTFTDRNGQLISIQPNGKISRRNLNLNSDHGLFATSKTLAVLDDNVLKIKDQQVSMDLGVYLGPQIFYLNDVIYVAVTDIQSQKLYVYRSTGALLNGFPVEAQGLPEMADLDGDRQPELGVRYRDSVIGIYGLKR